MKVLFVFSIALLMSGCGNKYHLTLDKQDLSSESYSYAMVNKKGVSTPFTEEKKGEEFSVHLTNALASFAFQPHIASGMHKSYRPKVADVEKNKLVSKYNPSYEIAKNLEQAVQKEFGWNKVALNRNPDFTIDVGSFWGIEPGMMDFGNYKVRYVGTFTVVDLRKEERTYEKFECKFFSESIYEYDEVYAENAKVVKQEMIKAADICTEELTEALYKAIDKDSAKTSKRLEE